jgi:hypothetical protein
MKASLALFLLALVSCTEDYTENPITIDEIIAFTPESKILRVPADGFQPVPIAIVIVADDDQKVTFTTEQGSFLGTAASSNKKQIEATTIAKKATVMLVPDQTVNKSVLVTASITKGDKSYKNFTYVEFFESYPDRIVLTADKNIIKGDQSATATMTVNTIKNGNSKVSAGIVLDIKAETLAGAAVVADVVASVKTSTDPSTTPVTFTIKSLNAATGTVKLTVSANGGSIVATKEITFN